MQLHQLLARLQPRTSVRSFYLRGFLRFANGARRRRTPRPGARARSRNLYPFALLGAPCSILGGATHLSASVYHPVVGSLLLLAAWQMARSARLTKEDEDAATTPAADLAFGFGWRRDWVCRRRNRHRWGHSTCPTYVGCWLVRPPRGGCLHSRGVGPFSQSNRCLLFVHVKFQSNRMRITTNVCKLSFALPKI